MHSNLQIHQEKCLLDTGVMRETEAQIKMERNRCAHCFLYGNDLPGLQLGQN